MAALQTTKFPEAAWRFTQFMSSGEGARLRATIQSIPPASKRVFDEVWMKANPPVRRQVLRDTHAWTLDLYKGRGIGDTHTAVNTALLKAWNGTASLNAAVQEAIQQGTQVLQSQKR
jgi:ABC-type glycerol-3-phosphate transport system substrate-binding protein